MLLRLMKDDHPAGDTARFWRLERDGQLMAELEERTAGFRDARPFASVNVWLPYGGGLDGTLCFEMERLAWVLRTEDYFQQNSSLLSLLADYLEHREEVTANA